MAMNSAGSTFLSPNLIDNIAKALNITMMNFWDQMAYQ
jgi:hypothetical protein